MIKSVFSKIFRLNNTTTKKDFSNNNNNNNNYNDGINISTISYFQSFASVSDNNDEYYNTCIPSLSSSSSSTNDINTNNNNNNYFKSQYQQNNQNNQNPGQCIYISPSCIRYSNSLLNDAIIRINENDINEISKQILDSNNVPPKLQIVLHDGNYYSINNSSLQIYKQLEKLGIITHVQADLLPLNTIPSSIRDNLLSNDESFDESLNDSELDMVTNFTNHEEAIFDETYEFGECEKCAESENDSIIENETEEHESFEKELETVANTELGNDNDEAEENIDSEEMQSLLLKY